MTDHLERAWRDVADHLDRLRAEQQVPSVVVGSFRAGRIRFASAGNLASGRQPTPDIQYRIGSITKTFTAAAVVDLARSGRLDLDEPLCSRIPEILAVEGGIGDAHQITVRHVLRHRSGLPGEAALPYWKHEKFPGPQRLLASLRRSELFAVPGTEFKYSNLGYALLGVLVSRAGGRSYRDYVDQLVGARGLTDTGWRPATPAVGHNRDGDAGVVPASFPDMAAMSPSGSLWSTCADQLRWLADHAAAVRSNPGPLLERPAGLGWFCTPDDPSLHSHGGAVPGYQSFVAVDVEADVGVVVLTDLLGHTLGEEVGARLLGRQSPRPERAAVSEPESDGTLAGVYQWNGLRAHVRRQGDMVSLSFPVIPQASAPPVLCRPGPARGQFIALSGRFAGEPLTFSHDGLTLPGGAWLARLRPDTAASSLSTTAAERSSVQGTCT